MPEGGILVAFFADDARLLDKGYSLIALHGEPCRRTLWIVLVHQLLLLYDGKCKPYWIGDEVGGLCDFDRYAVLSPAEMVLIIDHHLTYDQVMEWIDAGVDYNRERESEKYINLDAWIKGERYEMLDK